MDDKDLIELVHSLGPKLYRFFLASRSAGAAEELVQEVFVRLVGSRYTAELGTLEAFAWGIAQNLNREAKRKSTRSELYLEDHPKTPELSVPPADDSVEALRKSVGLLNEPEKTIMMFVLADLEIREIAKQMSMPEGTVKSHIHRAKENLKITFKKWGIL